MRTKLKKLWACALALIVLAGLFAAFSFPVSALELGDIKVYNIQTDSEGYLERFDLSFETTDGSVAAEAKMSVGTVDLVEKYAGLPYNGLTNYGQYCTDHAYTDWPQTPADLGFVCWNSGGTFLRGGEGETTTVTVQFPAKTVQYTAAQTQTLYFYLWAKYAGEVYPDYKITSVSVGNGSVNVGGEPVQPEPEPEPEPDPDPDCSDNRYAHLFIKTPGTLPTCLEAGSATYYTCENCGRRFFDPEGEQEITDDEEITLPAAGHNFVEVKKDNQICMPDASVTYYQCKSCGLVVSTIDSEHQLVKVSAKKATFTKDGNIAYYTCKSCGKNFADAAASKTITKQQWTIPKVSTAALSQTVYSYNGKERKPSVTLRNSAGQKLAASSYTVTYSGTKGIGTAKAKIQLKGSKYSGTKTLTYKIQLPAPQITSLTNPSSRTIDAKWSKVSIADGYQFVYCRTKDFTGVRGVEKHSGSTKVKTHITLLNVDTYYCRVRAYKKIDGKTYYSAWSDTAKIKVTGTPGANNTTGNNNNTNNNTNNNNTNNNNNNTNPPANLPGYDEILDGPEK